jgi:hypothetical protein
MHVRLLLADRPGRIAVPNDITNEAIERYAREIEVGAPEC